jgi:hypothetical protein
MTFVRWMAGAVALGVTTLIGWGLSTLPAQAAYTVTLEQEGSNVVATGSGTLDVTDLRFITSGSFGAQVQPVQGEIFTGQRVRRQTTDTTGSSLDRRVSGAGPGALPLAAPEMSSASPACSATLPCQRATPLALLCWTCRPTTM